MLQGQPTLLHWAGSSLWACYSYVNSHKRRFGIVQNFILCIYLYKVPCVFLLFLFGRYTVLLLCVYRESKMLNGGWNERYILILSPARFCSVPKAINRSWVSEATGVIQVSEVMHELQGNCGLRANTIFWRCISCVEVTFNILTPLRMQCVFETRKVHLLMSL